MVVKLRRSQKSQVGSQKGKRPWAGAQWRVVSGKWEETMSSGLPSRLLSSPTVNLQSSIFNSPAPSTQHLAPETIRLNLVGANPHARIVGVEKLGSKSNYFIGNDPKKWRTNVPNYAKVLVKEVYPGIDQVFYGKGSEARSQESGGLEFDFIVHPGADPKAIRLAAETDNWKLENGKWRLETGNSKLETSPDGRVLLRTDAGEVRLGKPVVYEAESTVSSPESTAAFSRQSTIDNRQSLQGQYKLTASNELRFELGTYDPTKTLVIDPRLNFISTFGGDEAAEGKAVAVDSAGNSYVAGLGGGTGFPTTPGSFDTTPSNAFVQEIDLSGNLVYSTFLAGTTGLTEAFGIAVDSSGDAYVTGRTSDTDFPLMNPFQATLAGATDAFVTELNPTGSGLIYSSYLGGALGNTEQENGQTGYGIAVDSIGSAYITGATNSSDFPTTPSAFQTVFGGGTCGPTTTPYPCDDAFASKVAPGGGSLVYSTFLGGSNIDDGNGIAVDAAGNAYISGYTTSFNFPVLAPFQPSCVPFAGSPTLCSNAFVTQIDPSGSALVFSTYLGGSCGDHAQGVALDSTGDVYVAGYTCSSDFPTANAFQGSNKSTATPPFTAFITQFSLGGAGLVYSTYLGGSGNDGAYDIAVDSLGEAFVAGFTNSTDFPVSNALQATSGGAVSNSFVSGFQAGGSGLIYSTYLGGGAGTNTEAFGIAVDGQGDAWVTGLTNATTFVAAITRPEVVHRYVPPRPLATSAVTAALAGSIALDMARVHPAPASLAFETQVVGATSAPQTLTISNPGTAPLTFTAITASDGFSVPSGGSCSTSSPVAPGGNCTVDVAFAPTAGGNLTGTLTLTDNGIGSPHSVPLSGIGQDFTLVTNQSSATLKAGVTATILFSVAPQGGFNHPLDLTCADPAPHSTCTITPASVTPNPASGATTVVSITTTAPSQVAPRGPNGPWPIAGHRPALQLWVFALALLALLAVAAMSSSPPAAALLRRRRPHLVDSRWSLPSAKAGGGNDVGAGMTEKPQSLWKAKLCATCFALALLLVLVWAACGGGGQPGTPAGTYTVTLKALDTQANLSHSTTVTLTVQ